MSNRLDDGAKLRMTGLAGAPQRRRSPVGEGPTQGGCWLTLIACERPSRVIGRAEPRDKAHIWWVSRRRVSRANDKPIESDAGQHVGSPSELRYALENSRIPSSVIAYGISA